MQRGRLIDVVSHLSSGTRLSTTEAFERVFPQVVQGSILQACALIVDAGLQEAEAVLSEDGGSVKLCLGKWLAWEVFTLSLQKDADHVSLPHGQRGE